MVMSRFNVCATKVICAIVLLFATVASTSAGDIASSTNQHAVAAKPKTVFELHCGHCSRSMSYRESFPSIVQALDAAEKARKESKDYLRTEIMSTDLPGGLKEINFAAVEMSYRVYVKPCKAWSLKSSHASLKDANDVVKNVNEANDSLYMIVPHYAQERESVARK